MVRWSAMALVALVASLIVPSAAAQATSDAWSTSLMSEFSVSFAPSPQITRSVVVLVAASHTRRSVWGFSVARPVNSSPHPAAGTPYAVGVVTSSARAKNARLVGVLMRQLIAGDWKPSV